MVDKVIDASKCMSYKVWIRNEVDDHLAADQVTNLREDILTYRLRYSLTSMEGEQGDELLNKAIKAMEK